VASAVAELPVPVIVALNGDATDHGLELALAGDLRLAVTGAHMGFSPLSRGMFPWDGGTQRLPRLVGPSWARDMLLTGRMVDAAEAYFIGLVNRVAASVDHLRQITAELAGLVSAGGPLSARYVKEAISKGMDLTLAQGLHLETDLNVILQSTTDRAEGINSFLEKRSPKFTGE
jgi:enoyl-CoA hydratase/carnithine racemase